MISTLRILTLVLAFYCQAAVAAERVDMQLVLLADTSISMDMEERQLQQQGFARAFRRPEIVKAILGGSTRQISITYVEWGGDRPPRVVIPWTLINSTTAALAFSAQIESNLPSRILRGTSISYALEFAEYLFENSPYQSQKNVINISGDGVNNNGKDLAGVRAAVLSKGVTINGMPIIYKGLMEGVVRTSEADMPRELLLDYYKTQVIGGPGAFIQPVLSRSDYANAIFKKLLREIQAATDTADNGVSWPDHVAAAIPVQTDRCAGTARPATRPPALPADFPCLPNPSSLTP